MIFARTIAHRVVLAGRAASPEMTADAIAADLELLGAEMLMISTQRYEE